MIARIVTASVVLLAAGLCAGDDKKNDKDLLQGDWVLVSMESPGKKLDEDGVKKSKLVVKGDEWLPTIAGRELRKMTFKVDPTKSPKEIDLTAKPKDQEITWRGIYKLDGDTLTVCRNDNAKNVELPKEFKVGEGVTLLVFKRPRK